MSSYSSFTDQELCVLLKDSDRIAFAEIYRRYFHNLYLHAYKMLADEYEAQDVIQELFISLWEKANELNINTNLKGYLYTTTRNRVINHIRKNRINDDFITMITAAMEDVDHKTIQQIDERDLASLIDEEINRLPTRMKQVFEMSRKNYLSNKQIAAQLGTSEETVKKQISKSIKTLKMRLGKDVGATLLIFEILCHRQ